MLQSPFARIWATSGAMLFSTLLACGDNTTPRAELPPLDEDPATLQTCTTAPPAAGATRAKRVICNDELLGGRMAAGRVGDLMLENDRVRVIIRGPGDGLYLFGTSGGAIIDAARHDRDDLLQELVPLVDLNAGADTELVVLEAGDDGPAEIAVRGVVAPTPLFAAALGTEPAGVVLEQRYRLEPGGDTLTIETRLYSDPLAEPRSGALVSLIDTLFVGGHIELRFPGRDADDARGPFLAFVGSDTSYALAYHRDDSALLTLVELAFFKLLESPSLTVDGDALTRYLVIGDGSMSSVVDRGWSLYGEVTARVSGSAPAGVEVVARSDGGALASSARPTENGQYSFELPLGRYTLTAEADDRAPGVPVVVDLGVAGAVVDLVAGATGRIDFTVTGDGAAVVARVSASATGFERIAYTAADGALALGVPPGSYTVAVSRGMEYDAFSASVVVDPDGVVALTAPLTRVLDTAGWISIDPHMHSEMSIDSAVPLEARLLSVAGEGVEVAVSSDHDFVVDYAPVATDLGLDATLMTMPGQESSSLIIGHINAWPTAVDPDRPGGGALAWYEAGPSTVFERARAGDASRLVQVNHPWDALGLFTAIGFDRATLMATRSGAELGIPGESLDDYSFDALEVGNKKTEDSFDRAFGDWLALVSAGFRIAATGASDSHGDDAYVGETRTFVFVGPGADDPTTLEPSVINEAIRAQRAVVSSGIFVTAGVVRPGGGASSPGELVDLSAETQATLRVRVQAPPWLPVSAVVIYERDTEIARMAVDPGDTQAIRFDADLPFPLDGRDTLFVVVAEAGGDGRPVMDEPRPSFTNPLYVDADGDGAFVP